MTSEEIVKLAVSLRQLGVSRFSKGDLVLEFAPRFEAVAQDEPEPAELSPMERAALQLTNRGRAA